MSRQSGRWTRATALLRRRPWAIVTVLVVVVAVTVAVQLRLGAETPDARDDAVTAGALPATPEDPVTADAPEDPSTADPVGAGEAAPDVDSPDEAPPAAGGGSELVAVTLPPMAASQPEVTQLAEAAELGGGVTGRVVAVEQVQASGHGRGQIAGDALLVTLELENTGAEAHPLAGLSVTAYLGREGIPAGLVDGDERVEEFGPSVEPGERVEARYVFSVPPGLPDGADGAVLSVMAILAPDQAPVVFQGLPEGSTR